MTMLRNTILVSSTPLMSHIGRKQLPLGRVTGWNPSTVC